MKVLIISNKCNYHAQAVSWGLKRLGVEVVIMPGISPYENQVGLSFDKGMCFIGNHRINSFDCVWFHRLHNQPHLYSQLHESDKTFARNETLATWSETLYVISDNVKNQINPYKSQVRLNKKLVQLDIANKVGFNVSPTILTNNPTKTKDFLEENQKAIYKSLTPYRWHTNNRNDPPQKTTRRNQAFLINKESARDDFLISSCPGIIQKYIEKAFDVRMIVFWETIISTSITPTSNEEMVDYRPLSFLDRCSYSLIDPPQEILNQVSRFMSESDLVIGAFDFSVDQDGKWWFLEVNCQGQWLFMEDWIPELNLLATFCSYILEKGCTYPTSLIDDKISEKQFEESEEFFKIKKESSHEIYKP